MASLKEKKSQKNNQKSVMFGDVFHTRADYEKGTFYAGRQVYLKASDYSYQRIYPGDSNSLLPPEHCISRKTLGKISQTGSTIVKNFKMEFKAKDKDEHAPKHITKDKKKNAEKVMIPIPPKFSSTNREDWVEGIAWVIFVFPLSFLNAPSPTLTEFRVGVKLYINHSTGEVSTECPYDYEGMNNTSFSPRSSSSSPKKQNQSDNSFLTQEGTASSSFSGADDVVDVFYDEEGNLIEGTGSLAYDSKVRPRIF